MTIEDTQNQPADRHIAIQKVGIKDIRVPATIISANGQHQATVASAVIAVSLAAESKGTHMSRFIELLQTELKPLDFNSFKQLLTQVSQRLNSQTSFMKLTFPYFVNKSAPISGIESLLDYQACFYGHQSNGEAQIGIKLTIPVKSLCPCSKAISQYGAHNQRSHINLDVILSESMYLEELITLAEAQASSPLYSLLKRPDEKYVTEKAYDNPKFVEDLVRDLACALNKEPRVLAYEIEVENFESIHNHSAYAVIHKNKQLLAQANPTSADEALVFSM